MGMQAIIVKCSRSHIETEKHTIHTHTPPHKKDGGELVGKMNDTQKLWEF